MDAAALLDLDAPTFFEVAAADALIPSLKAALTYSLAVYAQRRTGLLRLLAHEDELFAALMCAVEYQSLLSGDASLAEGLYGLQRTGVSGQQLSGRQRLLSLVTLVALPYLRTKAERAYVARTGGEAARLGLVGGDDDHQDSQNALSSHAPETLRGRLESLLVACFPYMHWAAEMSMFATGVAYVFGATRAHSPALAVLRLRMARTGPEHLAAFAARTLASRRAALDAARTRRLGAVRALLLRAWFTTVDGTRPGLFAAVLGFKLAEWWFNTAQAALQQAPKLPVPPPPPRLPVAPDGVPLPPDSRVCPVCLRLRVNPAVAAPSGIVYCYTCIRDAVDRVGHCPVTGVRLQMAQVRRLYSDGGQ